MAQKVKNSPVMPETWFQSLGQKDSPREENSYPLHTFAWRIPWTEVPGALLSTGSQRVRHVLLFEKMETANLMCLSIQVV